MSEIQQQQNTAKQPTASQTAAVRTAYANANIPAGLTTEIVTNPASATAAYGALNAVNKQSEAMPSTTPETITTTERVSVPRSARTTPNEPEFKPQIIKSNAANFVYLRGGGPSGTWSNLQLSQESQMISPAQIDAKTGFFAPGPSVDLVKTGTSVFNPATGVLLRMSAKQTFTTETGTPLAERLAVNPLPQLGVFGHILNFLYLEPEILAQVGQSYLSKVSSQQNPVLKYGTSILGVGLITAGAFGSFYNPSGLQFNTSTPEGRVTIVAEGAGIALQAVALGAGFSAFEKVTGIAKLSRVPQFAARFGYGSLFGAGQSVVTGQNPITGALVGGATFSVGGLVIPKVVSGARSLYYAVSDRFLPSEYNLVYPRFSGGQLGGTNDLISTGYQDIAYSNDVRTVMNRTPAPFTGGINSTYEGFFLYGGAGSTVRPSLGLGETFGYVQAGGNTGAGKFLPNLAKGYSSTETVVEQVARPSEVTVTENRVAEGTAQILETPQVAAQTSLATMSTSDFAAQNATELNFRITNIRKRVQEETELVTLRYPNQTQAELTSLTLANILAQYQRNQFAQLPALATLSTQTQLQRSLSSQTQLERSIQTTDQIQKLQLGLRQELQLSQESVVRTELALRLASELRLSAPSRGFSLNVNQPYRYKRKGGKTIKRRSYKEFLEVIPFWRL